MRAKLVKWKTCQCDVFARALFLSSHLPTPLHPLSLSYSSLSLSLSLSLILIRYINLGIPSLPEIPKEVKDINKERGKKEN